MTSTNLLYSCLSLVFLLRSSYCYFITIDAHGEECFHDRVNSGTKMGLIFEVAEGGFLDIDVKVLLHSCEMCLLLLIILSLNALILRFLSQCCGVIY